MSSSLGIIKSSAATLKMSMHATYSTDARFSKCVRRGSQLSRTLRIHSDMLCILLLTPPPPPPPPLSLSLSFFCFFFFPPPSCSILSITMAPERRRKVCIITQILLRVSKRSAMSSVAISERYSGSSTTLSIGTWLVIASSNWSYSSCSAIVSESWTICLRFLFFGVSVMMLDSTCMVFLLYIYIFRIMIKCQKK